MSADLLAAFGDPAELEQNRQADSSKTSHSHSSTAQHSLFKPTSHGNDVLFDADDELPDDEFGDFEDARPESSQGLEEPRSDDNIYGSNTRQNTRHEVPLIDLLSQDDEPPLSSAPAPRTVQTAWTTATATVSDPQLPTRVDEGTSGTLADDGWGEFADVEQPETQPEDRKGQPLPIESAPLSNLSTTPSWLTQTNADVLEDTNSRHPHGEARATKARSKPEPGADDELTSSTIPTLATFSSPVLQPSTRSNLKVPSKAQAEPEPEPEPEEDWEDFEDRPPENIDNRPDASTPLPRARPSQSKLPPTRPTNVPPPSLLLSFLPITFLDLLQSGHAPSEILSTFHVASRVIAGRSLRWKRDTLLSQSTRIATAGRPGSMKLASVNKSENLAEEREAAEVVEVWSRNLVKLQAALAREKVAVGGGAGVGLRLATSMAVKTATGPAIMEAKVICALCGLKRNERIVGIDDRAEDVFGEFWVETWGHRECCEWWEQWKGRLRQR